jgi:hypothetical protein
MIHKTKCDMVESEKDGRRPMLLSHLVAGTGSMDLADSNHDAKCKGKTPTHIRLLGG